MSFALRSMFHDRERRAFFRGFIDCAEKGALHALCKTPFLRQIGLRRTGRSAPRL